MNKKRYIYIHGDILYLYRTIATSLTLVDGTLNHQAAFLNMEDICKCLDGGQVILVVLKDKPDPDLLSPVSDDSKFADSDTYWAVKMVNLLGELAHLPPEAEIDEGQVNGLIGLVLDIIN